MGPLVDYHVHTLAHGEGNFDPPNLNRFIRKAWEIGLAELGVSEHGEFIGLLDAGVWEEVERSSPLALRLGLEVSYRREREDEIRDQLTLFPFDYVIGSIHHVAGWPFDHPEYINGYASWEIDDLYRKYFENVAQAVASGLFDVVGHLDLVKVFGYRSKRPVLDLADEALEAIGKAGLVVEINTAGLFKPAGEIYPAVEVLQACFARGIPITFGSDAHRAPEVGRELARAAEMAWEVGYRHYARFRRRQVELVAL